VANLDRVVRSFSEAVQEGHGALFLGAGVSVPSGLPDWAGLLNPLVAPLGLSVESTDDLPLLAQHVVNYHHGRGPLIGGVRHAIGGRFKPNPYHDAIAQTDVDLIWTTNFDTLIEDSLRTRERVAVRTADTDITSGSMTFDREVLKMHGCIQTSAPKDLVITSEDFEDYTANRPVFTQRLRQDLLQRRFLFVGYGFGDPNIRTVAVEARRMAEKTPREHFMIMRVDPTLAPEKRRRVDLWIDDLRRVGIDAAVVDDFPKVAQALFEISLRSRGRSVFVTGSHTQPASAFLQDLGTALAELRPLIRLLDGQSEGVGRTVANAFGAAALHAKHDLRDRVRFFPNPYAVDPSMANNVALLPTLRAWRASLFRSAHTVVVFDGGMGTTAEVEVAREMRCRIVPVPLTTSGLPIRLLADPEIRQSLDSLDPHYVAKASTGGVTAQDVARIVEKSLT
jgi:hypothetical protein